MAADKEHVALQSKGGLLSLGSILPPSFWFARQQKLSCSLTQRRNLKPGLSATAHCRYLANPYVVQKEVKKSNVLTFRKVFQSGSRGVFMVQGGAQGLGTLTTGTFSAGYMEENPSMKPFSGNNFNLIFCTLLASGDLKQVQIGLKTRLRSSGDPI